MKKVMKAVAAIMLMAVAMFAAGCTKPDDPNNGGNGGSGNGGGNGGDYYDGVDNCGHYDGNYEYVDLDLPSGTLWATFNVGADRPEGYGDYFAWGETQPKDNYDLISYKWCNDDLEQLTKYCPISSYGYNGYTDTLSTLLPEDDAATVNWGDEWRMPTQVEWQELYDNTISTWTTQNGLNGRLFVASNGKTLFLPATGGRFGIALSSPNDYGNYWSSSLAIEEPVGAWYSGFRLDNYVVYYDGRTMGRSVRPVRSSK